MQKNKSHLFLSIIICIICIISIFLIVNLAKKNNLSDNITATSYESLVLNVKFYDNTQKINIWKDEENNIFYFFLPSSKENINLCFGNIAEGDFIYLENQKYTSNDYIDVVYLKKYNMEFIIQGKSQGIQQLIFMQSENLPSMFIETETGSVDSLHNDKEIKENAEISLLDSEGLQQYSNSIEYIKTRGNSTFRDFEKKPYQIKLYNSESLLGMPESKKWILLANSLDDSLIRNELVFRYTENYMPVPSIQGEFIDLYINGNYVGNYYLCEKIEISENKLNITDLEEQTKQINSQRDYENAIPTKSEDGNIYAYDNLINPSDITGGYLVERTAFGAEMPINSFITDSGESYVIVSPEKATMEQAKYICNLFNEFECAVKQENGINVETGKHFSEYMNIESWASKYVIEEVFANPDASFQSMFFYKDSDSNDTRINCGPVWDYDRAIGGYGVNQFWIDNPEQIGEFGIYVDDMMLHDEVRVLVHEKFEQDIVPYVDYILSADVYTLSKEIEASHLMDKTRWPKYYGYYNESDANYDYLIDFLKSKVAYLEEVWLGDTDYCEIIFLDYYGNIYKKYTVKKGNALGFEPVIANYENVFNGWYSVETGKVFDASLPIYSDMTFSANWIPVELLLENGLDISEIDISQVDTNVLYSFAEIINNRQQSLNDKGVN